jgi:hypothetical protein
LKFLKKPIFSIFAKKRQNHVFGRFQPQIRKEHQKLEGKGEFGQTRFFGKYSKNKNFQYFSKNNYNLKKRIFQ